MAGLGVLTSGSDTDKLRFLFEVYDVDGTFVCTFDVIISPFLCVGNGCIEPQELRVVLKSCMDESRLKFSDDKLDELTRVFIFDRTAIIGGNRLFRHCLKMRTPMEVVQSASKN